MIQLLFEEGAVIRVWDPAAIHNFEWQNPNIAISCETIDDALLGADICFIMTDWDEIKTYPPEQYAKLMNKPILLDGRNCYQTSVFIGTGVLYDSIGRPTVNEDIIKE